MPLSLPSRLQTHLDFIVFEARYAGQSEADILVRRISVELACLAEMVEMTAELSEAFNALLRHVESLAAALAADVRSEATALARTTLGHSVVALSQTLAKARLRIPERRPNGSS